MTFAFTIRRATIGDAKLVPDQRESRNQVLGQGDQREWGDAPALLEIYRPFVESTAVSFELEVPSVEEFAGRISKAIAGWDWLVADRDGQPIGYAYASSHRQRAAYRYSVEVSAYVHPDYRRQGVARALYLHLFESLAQKGYCNAYAGVRVPNDASVAFHLGLGFEPIGVFKSAGWKFGQWQDIAWFHKVLRTQPPLEV